MAAPASTTNRPAEVTTGVNSPVNSANAGKPANAAKPANVGKSVNVGKPTNAANAGKPAKPAKPANAPKPANAANAGKSVNAGKPANAANVGKPANAVATPEDPALTKFKGLLDALKQVVDGKADCKTLEKPVKDLIQAGEQNVKTAKNKGALQDADLAPLAKEIETLLPSIQQACKLPAAATGGGYRKKRKTRKRKANSRRV